MDQKGSLDCLVLTEPTSGAGSASLTPAAAVAAASTLPESNPPNGKSYEVKNNKRAFPLPEGLQENGPSPFPQAKLKGLRSGRHRPEGLRILADVSANICR